MMCTVEQFKDARQIQKWLTCDRDKEFYVTNGDDPKEGEDKEPQEVIDEIMADVEKKMECLDAIEKHNNQWADRMNTKKDSARSQRATFEFMGHFS